MGNTKTLTFTIEQLTFLAFAIKNAPMSWEVANKLMLDIDTQINAQETQQAVHVNPLDYKA